MSVVGGELGWLGQQLEVTSTRRIAGLVGVTPSKSHQRKERVQDPTPNHLSREGRGAAASERRCCGPSDDHDQVSGGLYSTE